VGILHDDLTVLALHLDVLSSFVHLSKDLDTLALDLGKSALFIFSLLMPNLLSPFGVIFLNTLFAVNQSRLQEIKAVILHLLDHSSAVVPLAMLLFLHQAPS